MPGWFQTSSWGARVCAAEASPAEILERQKLEASALKLALLIFLLEISSACAGTVTENFATNPSLRGWGAFGETNLFQWNSTSHNLQVTWDSSKTNSYFYKPVGTIVNRFDDFSLAVDLRLNDAEGGVNPNKPATFEMAFGFQNFSDASRTNFYRGISGGPPNLAEFDFFPDAGFGPTVWPGMWSTNASLNYNGSGDYTIIDLPIGTMMHVAMTFSAATKTFSTTITTNGASIGAINPVKLSSSFTDFRLNTFAISSYSDAVQPQPGGSILAHGVITNIQFTVPPAPVQDLRGAVVAHQWQAQFLSRTNWTYLLEMTQNFQTWTATSAQTNGNGGTILLPDTNAVSSGARFYRVRAQRAF